MTIISLYDELEVDEQTRALIYGENLKRFLGISKNVVQHKAQTAEGRFEKH